MAPHHIEESRSIPSYFLAQFSQRDKLTRACRHLHLFTAAVQIGELHQQHIQFAGVLIQGLQRSFDPRNIAVVIGAPDINDAIKTAL